MEIQEFLTNCETGEMTRTQAEDFNSWFWKEIGTEAEINDNGNDTYHWICFDVTQEEVGKIRTWQEKNL